VVAQRPEVRRAYDSPQTLASRWPPLDGEASHELVEQTAVKRAIEDA